MKLKIYLGLAAICLIWGSTWLALKLGLESFPPLLGSSIRFGLAAVILFFIVTIRKDRFPENRQEWFVICFSGIFSFGLGYSFVYSAAQFIPSSLSSILFTTYPFWVSIWGYFLLKETTFTPVKIGGIIIGFIGIVIIFGRELSWSSENGWVGMTLVLLSAMVQAMSLIFIKKWASKVSPFQLNFLPMAIGSSLQFIVSVANENWSHVKFDFLGISMILYLAIFGSVIVFVIYWWLLSKVQAVTLSLSAFITPITAVILGIWVAGEHLSFWVYFGGLITFSGIALYNFGEKLISKKSS